MLSRIVLSQLDSAPGGKTLTEGERVFVRVLASTTISRHGSADGAQSGGKYVVSFAGARFLADSVRSLKAGDSFPATIKIQDGKTLLVPADDTARNTGVMKLSPDPQGARSELSAALSTFLLSLGIPADFVSLSLVRFMQQFGFKFDQNIAARARRLAKQFPANEAKAAEAALYLIEKGIDPDADMIEEILSLHAEDDGQGSAGAQNSSAGNQSFAGGKHSPQEQDEQTEDGEKTLIGGLYDNASLSQAEPGFLTLCNHIVSSERHWVLLPFSAENSSGIIRFLLNVPKKNIEKAEIRAHLVEKTWYFVVYYTAGLSAELLFFCDATVNETQDTSALAESLKADFAAHNTGERINVRYSPDAKSAGLFTEDVELHAFRAEV
jgi:hypothetical protein